MQPVFGLQVSSVQGLPSLQLARGPPAHTPPLQVSPVVHAFASLHADPSCRAERTQPAAEASELVVQALPSVHGEALLAWTQPVVVLHESLVQALLSSQLGAAPPTHTPPLQVSLVVQAFPSLHGDVLLV